MPNIIQKLFQKTPMSSATSAYEFFLENDTLPASPRILDLGTGGGHGARYLQARIPDGLVLGIDLAYECARPPGGLHEPPYFIQGDALALPMAESSLDAVIAVMAFHCLPEPERIIREAVRTLRPGGKLLIADVNGEHWMARPFEWVEHWFISPLTRAYTVDQVRGMMSAAGLTGFQMRRRPGKENGFMQWMSARKPPA